MRNLKLLFVLVGLVAALWIAAPFFVSFLYSNMSERGQFGDTYGFINALFSGLAFAGLFYTIHLQARQLQIARTELKIQREELRLQREELAASRNELERQASAQQALCRAVLGLVTVAAVNAQIEAVKVRSESRTPGFREEYATSIDGFADQLHELAKTLNESDTG